MSQRDPRPMAEADLQAAVIQLAELLGWRCYHTHDSRHSAAGFPDLVLVHARQGRVLFRELKGLNWRGRIPQPTAAQDTWLEDLRAAGQDAAVWTPAAWATGRIERELEGPA